MDKVEAFEIWAPHDSIWSVWANPVLFAAVTSEPVVPEPPADAEEIAVAWAPALSERFAIIVDLPGATSAETGLALARQGYRPVPLYNCARGPQSVVNVDSILHLLFTRAPELKALPIPPDAPPAFLLDANRQGNVSLSPGRFDNRWMIFPEDFPSANFLLAHGIRQVLLVQNFVQQPPRDLAHVLLRWQEARISIIACGVQSGGPPQPLTVSRPSYFKKLWYRALVLAGLRRHSGGGFGAMVPEVRDGGYG